jgi:exodeoxyribonuclease VII small subunit
MSDFEQMSFEELVTELEATIQRMAAGDIGIEETTDLYERAGRLHKMASERLAKVQERIERLTGSGSGPEER